MLALFHQRRDGGIRSGIIGDALSIFIPVVPGESARVRRPLHAAQSAAEDLALNSVNVHVAFKPKEPSLLSPEFPEIEHPQEVGRETHEDEGIDEEWDADHWKDNHEAYREPEYITAEVEESDPDEALPGRALQIGNGREGLPPDVSREAPIQNNGVVCADA